MKKTQKGFALLETLLILIVIGILGAVGWYALHTKHQTDQILSQADKISQSTPAESSSAAYFKCVSNPDEPNNAGVIDKKTYACTVDGRTYNAPAFSTANIVGYRNLPGSVKSTVSTYAKNIYETCLSVGEPGAGIPPVPTKIAAVQDDSFVILETGGCADEAVIVLKNAEGNWAELTSMTLGSPNTCNKLKALDIPPTLLKETGWCS